MAWYLVQYMDSFTFLPLPFPSLQLKLHSHRYHVVSMFQITVLVIQPTENSSRTMS